MFFKNSIRKLNACSLLPVIAASALLFSGQSHAVSATNQNGTMLVTMTPADSLVVIRTLSPGASSILCSDDELRTSVFEADAEFELVGYCDVRNVRVAGLNGDNIVSLINVNIAGKMDVRGGGQDDTVRFRGDNHFGQLSVSLRGGDNNIEADLDALGGWLGFLFPASNSVNINTNADIDTNNGKDKAKFKSLIVGGTADIDLGGGNDVGVVRGSNFNQLYLRMGGGNNKATVKNTWARRVQVFGGGNEDNVKMKNVSTENGVDIITSGGDDMVEVENVNAGTSANANGGNGTDCLIDLGFIGGSSTTISNFEACTY